MSTNTDSNKNSEDLTIASPDNKMFFKKLFDGDFGLVKTYWLFGVFGFFFANLAVISLELSKVSIPYFFSMLLMVGYLAYYVLWLFATWNASNKYKGSKKWAIFAKIIVIINAISIIYFNVVLFFMA